MSFSQWLFPTYNERLTLSLAGVVQSAYLVEQFAEKGYCDEEPFTFCVSALVNTTPESDEQLFGDQRQLQEGLKELALLKSHGVSNKLVLRYSVQILHLQKMLTQNQIMQDNIFHGLEHAARQLTMYGADNENLIKNLADLYQNTISKLGFRIQIQGKPLYLQQDNTAARIRVLLFSAIRFAFLWRQSGGHTHHILLAKNTIANKAISLKN